MLSLDDRKRCCQAGWEKVVPEKRTRLAEVEVGGVNQVEVFLWLDVHTVLYSGTNINLDGVGPVDN